MYSDNFTVYEVLLVVTVKATTFWDVTLYSLQTARRFGGTYRIYL
jgi:hypothetical protein